MTILGRAFSFLSLFICLSISAQNSLENASFEFCNEPANETIVLLNAGYNGLDNWTIGGAGIMYIGSMVNPSEGKRSIHLNRVNAGWVEQKWATVAGQQYRVTYDASAYVGPTAAFQRLMRGKATVTSASASVLGTQNFQYDGTAKTFPNPGWTTFTFDFTADSTNATVRFESLESGSGTVGPMLDNVRVVPGRLDAGAWVSDGALVWKTRMGKQTQTTNGATQVFAPEALGAQPITYQWYKRTGSTYNVINGATTSTYTLAPIASNSGAIFRVIASNSLGSITNETTLAVIQPPRFATQPREQRVSVGAQLSTSTVSFSGSAPDTYQWHKSNQPIPGATNSSYFKPAAELSDAGDYFLKIGNLAGETNSATFPIVVVQGVVPPWFRANNQPQLNVAVEIGSSLSLFASADGGQPISYYWRKNGQIIPDQTGNSFFKSGVTEADAGTYSLLASNSVTVASSSNSVVLVYPQQTAPTFASADFRTNAAAGAPFALTFPLTQGTLLSFQWYKRLLTEPIGRGVPIDGATAQTLTFPNLTINDTAQYTLVATNYKGSAEKAIELNVTSPPVFASAPQGYEGGAGGLVNMNANIANWSSSLTYRWYRNGDLIPNATSSFYNFTASAATAGSYTVIAKNEAGETTSAPAIVTIRELTPADAKFLLVANYTTPIPSRTSLMFNIVNSATINDGVVTFFGKVNVNDVGGLYRWTALSNIAKIVDNATSLPGFTAFSTNFGGNSQDDSGKISFIAGQAENSEYGVFEWQNGSLQTIATHGTDMPGRPGLKFGRFGYTAHASGKMAFLGMESVGFTGYRGLFVWNGSSLSAWASNDQPLPAGNGVWAGNSSQVGFDGATIAVWCVDGNNANGIFKSVNAGPLEKIAFTGDAIPGGLGTFKSFYSPPTVTDGKILFLADANERSGNMLLEHSALGLRVIAKTGDAPVGAGAFFTIDYNFKHAAPGAILFGASGPGAKRGIYRWSNGAIHEELTTLNTINGSPLNYVSLSDADGEDAVIYASFNGTQFGLYATVGNNGPAGPKIQYTVSGRNITLSWDSATTTLQESTNLTEWNNVSGATSPKTISAADGGIRFYRLIP